VVGTIGDAASIPGVLGVAVVSRNQGIFHACRFVTAAIAGMWLALALIVLRVARRAPTVQSLQAVAESPE
jgi:hypothetical protein